RSGRDHRGVAGWPGRPGGAGHARPVGLPAGGEGRSRPRRGGGGVRRHHHPVVGCRGSTATAAVLDRAPRMGVDQPWLARGGPGRPPRTPDPGPHRVPRDRPPPRGGRHHAQTHAAQRQGLSAGLRTRAHPRTATRLGWTHRRRRRRRHTEGQVLTVTEERSHGGRDRDQVTLERSELADLRAAVDQKTRSDREKAVKIDALGARPRLRAELRKGARDELGALRREGERLGAPPSTYGVVLEDPVDGETAEVMAAGRGMRLALAPGVEAPRLSPGTTVRLNEAMTVVEVCAGMPITGVTAMLRDILADGRRARVVLGKDEEQIDTMDAGLRGGRKTASSGHARAGDAVL